jgi:hypothetical protein
MSSSTNEVNNPKTDDCPFNSAILIFFKINPDAIFFKSTSDARAELSKVLIENKSKIN